MAQDTEEVLLRKPSFWCFPSGISGSEDINATYECSL